ncbi:MAG: GntR family transcriptional regulator [Micromonosporaceae bacterium]
MAHVQYSGTGEAPLYQALADTLRASIRGGQLRPGDQVPTEHELMVQHNVSRNTVRLALNLLTSEGLITGGRGRAGRQVRLRELVPIHVAHVDDGVPASNPEDGPYSEEMHGKGFTPSMRIEVAIVQAPEMAARLDLPADATLVVRRRTRFLDGVACSIADSFYPYEIVKGTAIMEPRDIRPGVIAWFAEHGWVQNRYVDEVSTKMPEPDEVARLGLGTGIPVLIQIRTGYVDSKPIRVTRTALAGNRHRIVYELPASRPPTTS